MFTGNPAHVKLKSGIILMLISLAGLAGLAPGAAVRAAPVRDQTYVIYEMWARQQTAHICVGVNSTIAAEVRQHTEVEDASGTILAELEHSAAGATITGSVRDGDIGTLGPSSVQTTIDVNYGGQGRADFSFHANKAGSTTLHFESIVGDRLIDTNLAITVENCRYEVTIVAFSVSVGGGVNIETVGLMRTQIAADNGQYQGSGSLNFNSSFSGPGCTINYSLFQVPTTITGPPVQNDELKLNFKFDPASLTSHVACDGGGSGTATHTIDLTHLNLPEAIFPVEGGTRAFKLNYAGSDAGDSTVIITVEPVE
jgi:hypothetical protein